jgi:hypothetical protein
MIQARTLGSKSRTGMIWRASRNGLLSIAALVARVIPRQQMGSELIFLAMQARCLRDLRSGNKRGNNREPIFFADGDYAHYRDWLNAAAAEYGPEGILRKKHDLCFQSASVALAKRIGSRLESMGSQVSEFDTKLARSRRRMSEFKGERKRFSRREPYRF